MKNTHANVASFSATAKRLVIYLPYFNINVPFFDTLLHYADLCTPATHPVAGNPDRQQYRLSPAIPAGPRIPGRGLPETKLRQNFGKIIVRPHDLKKFSILHISPGTYRIRLLTDVRVYSGYIVITG